MVELLDYQIYTILVFHLVFHLLIYHLFDFYHLLTIYLLGLNNQFEKVDYSINQNYPLLSI